ncbi:LysR family transcriptional regulator [Achromobacter sp. RTa]|uniref:LysR family transcriptional regulator n=1 Tax=Achromobacter sp. RTa TaxID=1532557 RepID=UPI0005107789|nr:LysR family transcriptional regulator [Achromobacter sp. RTa]KGD94210.1 LysR family transcriptional regulator [Achromobacter sp. RTa]
MNEDPLSPVATARKIDRLDWNLLRTFLVIVQERSISGAAIKLHITQSAVSQALRRLEQQLDRRLIERHHARFAVTQAGEEVRQAAEAIHGSVSQLVNDVAQAEEQTVGRIHVLVASRIHSAVYDDFWAGFHRAHPRIEVQLDVLPSSEIVSVVQQRGATAGIALCRQIPKRLDHKLFLQQRYALFCGRNHALFGRPDIRMEDLLGEDFVSFASDALGDSLSPLTIFRDQRGFSGRIVATSSQHDEVKRLLVAGFGIGCLPEHSVQADLAEGRLWRLPPGEGVCAADLHLLWRGDAHRSAAEDLFIASFRKHIDNYSLPQRLLATLPQ